MISVGEYGYTANGECYYVVAHVEGKYVAAPVYESEGGEFIEFDDTRTISKLFEEAPKSKKSDEILRLNQEIIRLTDEKKALSADKNSITNEISRLERECDEIDELFPFLRAVLRIKKGEKLFYVKKRGYAEYIWGKVEPEWGGESEMSATLIFNRRNGKLNIYGSPELHETEEQAKEAAQRLTIEDLQNYPPSEREYYPLAKYIADAEKVGFNVPKSIMKDYINEQIERKMSSRESCFERLAEIDGSIEELKQKSAALDDSPEHQPKDTTNE